MRISVQYKPTGQSVGRRTEPSLLTTQTRSEATAARIIAAAKSLFVARNYSDVTTDMIATAAEITKGGLYHHFASKEDLLVAVYEFGLAEISQAVSAAVAASDPWDRFEAACTAHLEALLKSSDYPQVVVRVLP